MATRESVCPGLPGSLPLSAACSNTPGQFAWPAQQEDVLSTVAGTPPVAGHFVLPNAICH